ncbi:MULTISPECIES: EAL domain-containing response regulator [unclassified Fibrobacter]|uniref:two-component system response regulator n=1 Tax=unclassified Fibrobacter TaxID=2634177 RepID=UPI000D6CAA5A|nr:MULTISPECIES: EAL domain-containing response regulator [unclassified Fibrobacter]PWJ59106.1 diguanylate cyclase (GGDEF)-like protein [Fibrobacter sp. UWR4]PZW62965.1 diguanylate cyclase (GGDEF)-like protein [Fibrobacter sp. UWR1]
MLKSEILIVDDSEINRSMLRLMLQEEYEITEAENGAEALAIIQKGDHIFRLVLLDLVMPVMDGFSFLAELQKEKLQSPLPIIIISGDNSEEALDKAYGLGAVDFFTKPFNPSIVNHRVQNVISLYAHGYRDKLTGCYTRNGFIQVSENFIQTVEDPTLYSIILYDLKNFKAINSVYGVEGGDFALKYTSNGIQNSGLAPLFVARLEADHFACLAESKNIDFNAMMEDNGAQVEVNGRPMQIRFRMGVAKVDSRAPITGFMDRAKLAMNYIEDEYLKPYAEFDEKMAENYVNAAMVTSDFENSLENNEFKVYYQPVMEAATGKIASAEALIRWIHPKRGFVRPDLFIPVLEKDGYISKLDLFVDLKVHSVVKEWKKQGLPTVPVSVNLSWMDFYDADMIRFILDRLESNKTEPGEIRYEITESSFAALKENHDEVLKDMQRLGAWLLMDDFGSGYSSLGMLMNYKFNILKIDMSIVRKLEEKPEVPHIVELIINMCHHLGMKVVAEGVETESQLNFLKNAGCDYIQGYYFSKPLPEEDFKAFLAKSKEDGKIIEN